MKRMLIVITLILVSALGVRAYQPPMTFVDSVTASNLNLVIEKLVEWITLNQLAIENLQAETCNVDSVLVVLDSILTVLDSGVGLPDDSLQMLMADVDTVRQKTDKLIFNDEDSLIIDYSNLPTSSSSSIAQAVWDHSILSADKYYSARQIMGSHVPSWGSVEAAGSWNTTTRFAVKGSFSLSGDSSWVGMHVLFYEEQNPSGVRVFREWCSDHGTGADTCIYPQTRLIVGHGSEDCIADTCAWLEIDKPLRAQVWTYDPDSVYSVDVVPPGDTTGATSYGVNFIILQGYTPE